MATAQQIIDLARTQIGYVEQPTNRTKYGKWYGLDGQPWCAMFISWLHANTGSIHLCNFSTSKGYAFTPSGAKGFQNRGQWGQEPRLGAHGFMKFPDGPDRIHHVGLAIAWGPGWVDFIEGNTSNTDRGSQRDGGGVRLRRRNPKYIVGYGYPAYEAASSSPPSSPPPSSEKLWPWPGNPSAKYGGYNRPEFENKVDGNVRGIQRTINRTNRMPKLVDDGKFGPKTEDAVFGFQGARKLKQDKIVGRITWDELRKF